MLGGDSSIVSLRKVTIRGRYTIFVDRLGALPTDPGPKALLIATTVTPLVRGDEKMTSLDWAPFALVADLHPHATIVSYQSLATRSYGGDTPQQDKWFNHHVAVIWDEDRDTRVLHALAYLVYAAPKTASRISAISEHKGCLTVWAAWIEQDDWDAFERASRIIQIGDYWPVEIRELVFDPVIHPDHRNNVWAVHTASPDKTTRRGIGGLRGLDEEDQLVDHINAIYPLGWWGARRRGEVGQD